MWTNNSGNNSELVAQLPLVPASTRMVVFSLPLPDLAVGDVVQAFGSFGATNPELYNVMVGKYLVIASSAGATTGIEVSEASTRNITPDMHHDAVQSYGSYKVTSALINRFLNYIAYTAANPAQAGDYVAVEPDYGRLFVNVLRAAELE